MNIVPPVTMPNLVVQAPSQPALLTREERQQDLLMHQMVRATVQEGGQEKALLQFGERKLWVESRVPLRAGERLSLQVIETHPTLKLRILDTGLLERLGRSLHLLGSRLDVSALAAGLLRNAAPQGAGPSAEPLVLNLQSLVAGLKGEGDKPLSAAQLQALSGRLGLALERQLLAGQAPQASASLKNALLLARVQLDGREAAFSRHLQPLLEAVVQLPQSLGAPGNAGLPPGLGEGARQVVEALLGLARLQSGPESGAAVERLAHLLGQGLERHLGAFSAPDAEALSRLRQVLAELAPLSFNPAAEAAVIVRLDGVQRDLLASLLRLIQREPRRHQGAEGEGLMRRLAAGLEKELLAGLRQGLERNAEALQHLEFWQMCRARMAEIGADFLPLPLGFLDQGYLLARRHDAAREQQDAADQQAWSLSLYLELEGLGRLQIDCLYQEKGLFVRFACRDGQIAAFLAEGREDLTQALGAELLRSATFSGDAETPEKALIRSLIPTETRIVNARV
ncbi:hypothetical protein [Geoalkalibacter halelectricus]|uniref:Hook-length control protein FliK n=1 Tax=Geoalkalibacter halelectricus TaxID=2847045 RepID=A0ABY5ZKP7_9BACT|nr:hypothetical protein [Geoalkalibacter halelectricus]MDO3378019.1 hypothetical protein [Geoalkalibacter halelectricus]UWZ78319.1 hypothetical protein L9S41_11520 [Geoalkalibacter halelectricus]